MPVPDQPSSAGRVGLTVRHMKKCIQIGFDRLSDQFPCSVAKQIRERVG